jgi:hypothetical protein
MRLQVFPALALAAALNPIAHAGQMQNEPKDFRGIEWGAAFERFADELRLVRRDDQVLVYLRKADKLSVGQADVMKVAYRFYKNKFSVGIIQTYGGANKRALRESLVAQFGEPERISKNQELDSWNGQNVQIVLSCSVTSYCAVEFISKQMIALEEKETGTPAMVLKKDDDGDGDGDDK